MQAVSQHLAARHAGQGNQLMVFESNWVPNVVSKCCATSTRSGVMNNTVPSECWKLSIVILRQFPPGLLKLPARKFL